MKNYIVAEKPLTVSAGLIFLSEAQAANRLPCLKLTKKKGIYEVTAPIKFKVGEKIAFPEGIVKTFRSNLILEEDYQKKGAEAANIEIDLEKFKSMETAFDELVKKYQGLENEISHRDDAFSEMESALKKASDDIAKTIGENKSLEKENASLMKKIGSLEEKIKKSEKGPGDKE